MMRQLIDDEAECPDSSPDTESGSSDLVKPTALIFDFDF
jgi:hypothetical protein